MYVFDNCPCSENSGTTAISNQPSSFRWIVCLIVCATACAWGQTKVTTWHYNNARTSANTTETKLTPANVNVNTFGKLFTQSVDGFVVGQPLYLPSVNILNQGLHNVVYVATMNDTVYAFDADSGTTAALWKTSLLPAGATAVPASVQGCTGTTLYTQIGIVSTPVIDPSSNTIYAVSSTYENLKVVHRLHALDVTSGLERTGSPVVITGSYTQNGVTYPFIDTPPDESPRAIARQRKRLYCLWLAGLQRFRSRLGNGIQQDLAAARGSVR